MSNKSRIFAIQSLQSLFSVVGAIIMERKLTGSVKEILLKIYEAHLTDVVLLFSTMVLGYMFLHYLLNFGQNEILKAWNSQDT